MAITHGGELHKACARFGGLPSEWLDLSTGIAPWAYPLPTVPEAVWQRLPEQDDGLISVASQYYQSEESTLLAVAGSQWAIEQIPRQYAERLRVGMLNHGYAEHPHAWQVAGHEVILYDQLADLLADAPQFDAAVLIQPHNPLGSHVEQAALIALKQQLRQGILVIDEAFGDIQPYPTLPLTTDTWRLRSIGKFFGLAGIRLGFVLAHSEQIEQLRQQQSPWSVNHPARWAATLALTDQRWQAEQTERLAAQCDRLSQLLSRHGYTIIANTQYFVTIHHPQSAQIYQSALDAHILLRYFPAIEGLRFGLPKTEGDWLTLERWLSEVVCRH